MCATLYCWWSILTRDLHCTSLIIMSIASDFYFTPKNVRFGARQQSVTTENRVSVARISHPDVV